VPEVAYGVLQQDQSNSMIEEVTEQVRRVGYAILDSGLTAKELTEISNDFDQVRMNYLQNWGEERLRSIGEIHVVRALLTNGVSSFMRLVMNHNLLAVLGNLIVGKFILNQQNGIINPSGETYSQGIWHRDLPYQHYISSSPLAVNALFCVDDFTLENGSTYVLPASHKSIAFPSKAYIRKNAVQVEAKAGQFIVLDSMLFHCGGVNRTGGGRRSINHVYNIPYFKQQIKLSSALDVNLLSSKEKEILGFSFQEPESIKRYLDTRAKKVGL
jgi:ectoine hydroxylase-related dioxygenase (phytanoyl-CoA dioxygenase family)